MKRPLHTFRSFSAHKHQPKYDEIIKPHEKSWFADILMVLFVIWLMKWLCKSCVRKRRQSSLCLRDGTKKGTKNRTVSFRSKKKKDKKKKKKKR